tara:strand:- start:1184 stop:1846 length:663 start_codon:yes stop_codon:yes gene_type:complete
MADNDEMRRLMTIIESFQSNDFEKIAFGNLKGAEEVDTDFEHAVYDALETYIIDNMGSDLLPFVEKLKQLQKQYPEDLIPNAKVVYRGAQMTDTMYTWLAGEYDNLSDGEFTMIGIRDVTPYTNIQAWTTQFDIAMGFALESWYSGSAGKWSRALPRPVIYKANVDSSFLLNTGLTNRFFSSGDQPEYEILRVATNSIKAEVIVAKDWVRQYIAWKQQHR